MGNIHPAPVDHYSDMRCDGLVSNDGDVEVWIVRDNVNHYRAARVATTDGSAHWSFINCRETDPQDIHSLEESRMPFITKNT